MERYKLNRIGLYNYWYYDYEEFHFKEGKLFLRGGNGAGKSVTMQTFITFLLDGNKDPHRLDPFGSRDRKMKDLLTGEKKISNVEDRIGYVFMEFVKPKTRQFITVGYGLEARKDKTELHDDWGFVIYNSFTRIGREEGQLKLFYEEKVDGKIEELPWSKSDFKKELGENGVVTESRGQYLKMVNRYLFGFPTEEYLEKYTELLVQLKSPKLSKEFNPDTVCEILTSSLPEITRAELDPLTESIESMNQIEEDIRVLRTDIQSINKINSRYDKYNELKLYEIGNKYLDAHRYVLGKKEDKKNKEVDLDYKNRRLGALNKNISQNEVLEHRYREEEVSLRQHEVHGIKSKLIQMEENFKKEVTKLSTKENQFGSKKRQMQEVGDKIERLKMELSVLRDTINDMLQDIEYDAEESKFELQHENHASQFKREFQSRSFNFSFWKSEAKEYKQKISVLLKLLRNYEEIRTQLKQIRVQIDNKNDYLIGEQKTLLELEERCEEVRGDLEEDMLRWLEGLEILQLAHEEKEDLIRMVNKVLVSITSYEFQDYIDEHVSKKKELLLSEKAKLGNKLGELKEERKEKEEELVQVKAAKVIEPERHVDKTQAIKELKDQNVPYLSFYEAVEFNEGLSEKEKRNIESVIVESGLLTSLIVPENYEWLAEQKLIILNDTGYKPKNLMSYLSPCGNDEVPSEDIQKVLSSISVQEEKEGNYILSDGRFQNGFVKGMSSDYGDAKFIGKVARERERKRKIDELTFEIESISEAITVVIEEIEKVAIKEVTLKEEHQSFPRLDVLREVNEKFENKKRFIDETIKPEIEQLEQDEDNKKRESEESFYKIRASSDFVELELRQYLFERAEGHMIEYLQRLNEIEMNYKIFVMQYNAINEQEELHESIQFELDDLTVEVNETKLSKDKLAIEVQSLRDQLKLNSVKEVEERIEFVVIQIKNLPEEREKLKDERSDITSAINTLKDGIDFINKTLVFDEQLVNMWQDRFLNEQRLNYVFVESPKNLPLELAEDIVAQLEGMIEENKKHDEELERYRERVETSFENVVNTELANLNEYNMSRPIESMYDGIMPKPMTEYQEAQLELFKNAKSRYKLTLEYEKIKRSSYEVKDKLTRNLERSEEALTQKEREVFEKELIAHIGGIIRNRIHDAEYWINEMNEFMKKTSESTNIIYKMDWVANKSDNEGEMNTKPLVDALKKDPLNLNPGEKEKVANHFRIKIKKAIKDRELTKKSLYEVMKEELDYRKWYTFQMRWQKLGDGEEDLTRLGTTQFNRSSGGEKALTMYTPLLSAVHSRLSEAAEDAPRIISLDEAFAGVDEGKIEGMFDLVEKLDFDYIMNSQALWGTYKTVSALSIVDLNRPGNVPYVNAEKYEWDGKNKVYLADDVQEEIHKEKQEQTVLQLG